MIFPVSKFCMKAAGDPFGLRWCGKSKPTSLAIITCDCCLRGNLRRRLFIDPKLKAELQHRKAVRRDSLAFSYVHVHPRLEKMRFALEVSVTVPVS